MKRTPAEIALNTAGACRFAAAVWRESDSAAQRAFAPVLDTWAGNAMARAAAAEDPQPDLFGADR